MAASSLGSMVVSPRAACAVTAATTAGGEWPNIDPVSPRQKSARVWPSTSRKDAPTASATVSGNGSGQSRIQCIGTPS